MARPTKLTPQVHERIVNAISKGNYIETAAALAGIDKTTLYDWLRTGADEEARVNGSSRLRVRKEEAIYVEFSHAVAQALAESEDHDLGIIAKAADDHEVIKYRQSITKDGDVYELKEQSWEFDWKAAAWRLERKFPDRYAPVTKTRLTGQDDATPIKFEVEIDAQDILIERIAAIAQRRRDAGSDSKP